MKIYLKIISLFRKLYEPLEAVVVRLSKKIILPGFDGMPLYDVVKFFFRGINQSSLISRANSLSFTFLLAIFPAIIFFFTLIPYIPIENLQSTILQTLENALPEHTYIAVKDTIEEIVKQEHGGLLSIGFLLSFYFSSNGMLGIMKAFNRTSHTIESRSFFKIRFVSVTLVLIVTTLVILAATMLIGASIALDYLASNHMIKSEFTFILINFGKWVITLIIVFTAISFIYYLAPAKRRSFKFISAGSTLATFLSLLFIVGFNYYIDNFAQYNKLYGSIGTLIILMLWIKLNAIVLLIGFELNASILEAKKKKEIIE
ncbi:MAG: YihY/virulence factor BrkB family protein [Bacteroidales bacterium]|nr:YihY/virulence factor BrkB family protein [Bacteroidales bacterium]